MPSSHITPSGGLFTHHFIEAIQQASFNHPAVAAETFALTGVKAPTPAELERTIASAWELLTERWDSLGRGLIGMSISDLRERWMRPLLTLLDFELEYQRADLVLEEDLRFPISYLGRAVAVPGAAWIPVHTVAVGVELEAKPTGAAVRGVKGLAAHDVLQRYLNLSRTVRWGLVTNGLRLRILRDYHHSSSRGYVEFDLEGIFEERDFAAFRALYRMCHVSRFQVSGENQTPELPITNPLELFYQHSQSTGVKVGDDLRKNVREAIELLANGFLGATPGLLDRLTGSRAAIHYPEIGDLPPEQAFFHDILTVIYRMLFLLFAEQRGMLPGRGSLYADEFSLTALRTRAERPVGEDEHLNLWERLRTTFRMVEKGAPGLGIFGYNGALFGGDRTPTLTPTPAPPPNPKSGDLGEGEVLLHNSALLRAVRALTTTGQDGALQRVSYADLSVEEIGSIYESLLDFTPRISRAAEQVEGRQLAPGTFFLDARGSARKTTGSYYTHPSLVNQLVQSALRPVLTERLAGALGSFDESQVEGWSESEREKAEAALLSLRVLDPAAGSGAFLISAMNTLGLTLARLRKGDFYPPEREIRRARRDVLAHCIYGVDMNPMAVELCKVSLWIDAAVDDAPLNFLDHHIRCGNSLVGATAALLAAGIPDEAYTPVSGDDKALARSARDENRRARDGQLSLWQVREAEPVYAAGEWQALNRLGEDNPREAETLFLKLQEERDFRRRKLAADLWTAAFFWRLSPSPKSPVLGFGGGGEGVRPPTTSDVRQAQADEQALPADLLTETERLSKKYRFFHWELEFADVFTQNGGFDVILGNPPWERVQFEERMFFENRDFEIFAEENQSKRREMILKLSESNPALFMEWADNRFSIEAEAKFMRLSNKYPLSAVDKFNLYAIFAELSEKIINSHGRAGIIVKGGYITDALCAELFADHMRKACIVSAVEFENKKKLFPAVHQQERYALITLGRGVKQTDFCFDNVSIEDLADANRHIKMDYNDILLLSPNTQNCPKFPNNIEYQIAKKCYSFGKPFVQKEPLVNLWNVSIDRYVNVSDKSDEIVEGFQGTTTRWFSTEDELVPIFEGKLLHQYDHRYATYTGESEDAVEISDKSPDKIVSCFRYISPATAIRRNPYLSDVHGLLAFRDITNRTNERGMIATIIPACCTDYTVRVVRILDKDPIKAVLLLSVFNSLVFDYLVRQRIGGTHLSNYILEQSPVPDPSAFSQKDIDFIVPRVLELIYTAHDLRPFAQDLGYTGEPFRWDDPSTGSGRRAQLRAELDAYYARLYRLTRDELRYILDPKDIHGESFPGETFRVLKEKEIRAYGEYRTKRMVLEAWDKLQGK